MLHALLCCQCPEQILILTGPLWQTPTLCLQDPGNGNFSYATLLHLPCCGQVFVLEAHFLFARACDLKSIMICFAASANAVNSCSSLRPTANVHAVFASSCELKSFTRYFAASANAVNNCSSLRPTVANAHAVVLSSCELKSFICCSAAALEYPKP